MAKALVQASLNYFLPFDEAEKNICFTNAENVRKKQRTKNSYVLVSPDITRILWLPKRNMKEASLLRMRNLWRK